jgi:hypothetical protein
MKPEFINLTLITYIFECSTTVDRIVSRDWKIFVILDGYVIGVRQLQCQTERCIKKLTLNHDETVLAYRDIT